MHQMFICDPQNGSCDLRGLIAKRWKALQMQRLPLINPVFAALGFRAVATFPAGQRFVRVIRSLKKLRMRRQTNMNEEKAPVPDAVRFGPDPGQSLRAKVLHGQR